MRQRRTIHWALTAAVVLGFTALALAEDTDRPQREPVVGEFTLKTAGVLAVAAPDEADAVRVRIAGKGRAVASRRGVVLKFGELTDVNGRVEVTIRFDNPLDRASAHHKKFAGHGVAVVTVGERRITTRVRVHGAIHRVDAGAMMRGQWAAVKNSDRFELKGGFHGSLVDSSTNDDS